MLIWEGGIVIVKKWSAHGCTTSSSSERASECAVMASTRESESQTCEEATFKIHFPFIKHSSNLKWEFDVQNAHHRTQDRSNWKSIFIIWQPRERAAPSARIVRGAQIKWTIEKSVRLATCKDCENKEFSSRTSSALCSRPFHPQQNISRFFHSHFNFPCAFLLYFLPLFPFSPLFTIW